MSYLLYINQIKCNKNLGKHIPQQQLEMKMHSVSTSVYQQQHNSAHLLQNISNMLKKAYKTSNSEVFQSILKNAIKHCMRRAQVQLNPQLYATYITKWVQQFNSNIQINARALIMQAYVQIQENKTQAEKTINKVKYMILDSPIQYLITKVLFLNAKLAVSQKQQDKAIKILKNCISYSENFAVNYLKQSQEVRQEIVEDIIISYYELHKLTRNSDEIVSYQSLNKAYDSALKNYGDHNPITQLLLKNLNEQNLRNNISQQKQKPNTLIISHRYNQKNGEKVLAYYFWQENTIRLKLIEERSGRLLSQNKLQIKLQMKQIEHLKTDSWFYIQNGQIQIDQEEIRGLLYGRSLQYPHFKNISNDRIFKKDNLSSSEDQEQLVNQYISFDPNKGKPNKKQSNSYH